MTGMTQTRSKHLPEYDNPPINEVVCGIHFERLDGLLNPYLGILWEKYKPEYSRCQEVPPLIPIIESLDKPAAPKTELPDVLPLPRTWFVHSNDNAIIQVQRDRFLHNWREIRAEDSYPRYHTIIDLFREHLSTFTTFLEEYNLGIVKPLQYELTYVNLIMQGEGWETISDIGRVFSKFSWPSAESDFLPLPESINWHTSFVLPKRAGRLHTKIQIGERRSDHRPLFRFELTARGIGEYKELETMWDWFDLAHETIVRGFVELTDLQIQDTVWRRKL
jgi:uncharacterized protein (TIGR04255 family)